MTDNGLRIRAGAPTDAKAVEAVYAAAFADDPVKAWALPSESDGLFRGLVERALEEDEVAVAERGGEIIGVATWLVLETTERIRRQAGELAELAAVRPELRRLAQAMGLLARHHPTRPHDYLATMGVVPAARGQGVGGALLEHRLVRADAQQRPAYLEASSERNGRLYARYGFAALGAPLDLAEGGPRCRPMWREPGAGVQR